MHREKLVERDLGPLITIPKRKSSLPHHVPGEKEMQSLLNAIVPTDAITTRDKAMLELLYATGMRNEEIRTATVDNLDIPERTLLITGKGSKDRVVPLGEWVIPYLVEYLEASRPKLLNLKQPTNLLFISKTGRRISNGNLGDIIRKYTKKAGIEQTITPHSFRHACATHLLKAGADIRYVQELLGHGDLSSTQIYTRIDISFLKKAHRRYHPREKGIGDEQ
jgi:integrase/recombinase XerD